MSTMTVRPQVQITVHDFVSGAQLEQAWQLYAEAFRELNALAVQRHLMYRREFDEVMADPRVDKYVATVDGRLVGLATFTNFLDAMPLISPAYFERHWPDRYAEQKVWYCGFVAVETSARGGGVFTALVEAMYRVAEAQDGIIGLDVCSFNDEARHLSKAIALLLHRLSRGRVRVETPDLQRYNVYDTRGAAN